MPLSRRQLLLGTVGLAAAGCTDSGTENSAADTADLPSAATTASTTTTTTLTTTEAAPTTVSAPAYSGAAPFALGVASGDPDAESVVLWTRLITAFDQTELIADVDLDVALDLALDEGFEEVVSSTLAQAPLQHGHSVHAVVDSLAADTWYYYRFRMGDHVSPTGRTRTMPSRTAAEVPTMRFGFSSC